MIYIQIAERPLQIVETMSAYDIDMTGEDYTYAEDEYVKDLLDEKKAELKGGIEVESKYPDITVTIKNLSEYFKERFEEFKRSIEELKEKIDLKSYESGKIEEQLKKLMLSYSNHEIKVVVFETDEVISFDRWLRYAEKDKKYYIGSVLIPMEEAYA